jgi:translation initiation factor 6
MHFMRSHLNGNAYLGIFAHADEGYLLHPPNAPQKVVRQMSEVLEVETVPTTIAGTELVGTLVASNSKGLLLPGDATETEVESLRSRLEKTVGVLNTKFNALGNLIMANDEGGLVGEVYGDDETKVISETLGVEVGHGTVSRLSLVGSLGHPTNTGVLVSPTATDAEIARIEDLMKVKAERGTANLGASNVGTCMLANSKGVVAGMPTTGIEMGKIQQVFEGGAW